MATMSIGVRLAAMLRQRFTHRHAGHRRGDQKTRQHTRTIPNVDPGRTVSTVRRVIRRFWGEDLSSLVPQMTIPRQAGSQYGDAWAATYDDLYADRDDL